MMKIRRHFTLLEMLLAMTIFMLIAVILAMTLRSAVFGWRRMDGHHNRVRSMRALEGFVDNAFRHAMAFTYPEPLSGTKFFLFDGREESLFLVYPKHISIDGDGALMFCNIFLEEDKIIAEYLPTPWFPPEIVERPDELVTEREILLDGVKALQFQYGYIIGGNLEWEDTWEGDQHDVLPQAIVMEVTFLDDTKEVWLRRLGGNTFYVSSKRERQQ